MCPTDVAVVQVPQVARMVTAQHASQMERWCKYRRWLEFLYLWMVKTSIRGGDYHVEETQT